MMKIVRQREYGQCMCACLAMLGDVELDFVLNTAKMALDPQGFLYLPMHEAYRWLAIKRIGGLTVTWGEPCEGLTLPFKVEITTDCMALVTVKSEKHPGVMHAVVWCPDRKMILDPQYDEPQDLKRYAVIEWNPLVHLTDGRDV